MGFDEYVTQLIVVMILDSSAGLVIGVLDFSTELYYRLNDFGN